MAINSIVQGDTRVWDIVITDRNNAVVDITLHKVWFTMKQNIADPDGTSLPSVLGPIEAQITDGPAGKCTITLPSTDTAQLTTSNYHYDFQWNDDSTPAVVTTLDKGMVSVTDQVTIQTAAP